MPLNFDQKIEAQIDPWTSQGHRAIKYEVSISDPKDKALSRTLCCFTSENNLSIGQTLVYHTSRDCRFISVTLTPESLSMHYVCPFPAVCAWMSSICLQFLR